MKTTLQYFFLTLLLCSLLRPCSAQLKKGQWLVEGNLNYSRVNLGEVTEVGTTDLRIGVGYFLMNRLAIGSGLRLRLVSLQANVTNQLWSRYYLVNQSSLSLFAGLRWDRLAINRARNVQQRPSRRIFSDYYFLIGNSYAITPRLLIEGIYNFGFLSTLKLNDDLQITDGANFVDIRLRLLLESNRKVDPFEHSPPPLQKGQWGLGGQIGFTPRVTEIVFNRRAPSPARNFEFRPTASYLLFRQVALGLEFDIGLANGLRTIDLGATLFGRYYHPFGKHKFLFADLGFGYTNILVKYGSEGSLFISDHLRSLRAGLGYAIFVTPQLSLDLFGYRLWRTFYKNFPSSYGEERNQFPFTAKGQDFFVTLGLQYYLFQ
ncbi:MAG: hypothetical protein AAGG75_05085 [Bacteroidota bacterium]